ncbi:MAG: hypothetical protein ACFFE5_11140 [Candidatus Thorarchaeota archaeon]
MKLKLENDNLFISNLSKYSNSPSCSKPEPYNTALLLVDRDNSNPRGYYDFFGGNLNLDI